MADAVERRDHIGREHHDCEQRVFPPLQHPLKVDENVRGVSFFGPVPKR